MFDGPLGTLWRYLRRRCRCCCWLRRRGYFRRRRSRSNNNNGHKPILSATAHIAAAAKWLGSLVSFALVYDLGRPFYFVRQFIDFAAFAYECITLSWSLSSQIN